DAAFIVDEAHATGVFGKNGEGIVAQENLKDKVFARVITFGKTWGLHGAAVLGSSILKNYLINFARSFIYTTALPPGIYSQIQENIKNLTPENQASLFELIKYFNSKKKEAGQFDFLMS